MSEMDAMLDTLAANRDVIGCAFATRDGLPGAARFTVPHDGRTLGAMAAAALAAAETAVESLDSTGLKCLVLEGHSTRTLLHAMDEQHMLIIVARETMPVDELLEMASSTQQKVRLIHA